MRQYTKRPSRERFEEKVMVDDGCWNWSASTRRRYGRFDGEGTHRLSYRMYVGQIPKGLHVLHKCDNRKCVNPTHLFLGTSLVNMRDKVSKNRQAKGEDHGFSKITSSTVVEIRSKYASGTFTQRRLALIYGLAQSHVWRILHNHVWSHLTS